MAQAPLNKLCLAAFCWQNALQAKKRDIFPAGKVWSSPAPPPIFPRSGNSLIWLANNVRETNLFSSFGFIWIKKGDTEDFRLQQTATKFGANIIWLLGYLFAKNFCL